MTNLQQNAPIVSPQLLRRLWFGLPAALLGLGALLLGAGALLPQWQALEKDSQRLRELEALQNEVSLMRQQLRSQDIQEEKALLQKDKLLRMIAGSGDVTTILAVLDREAKAAGVQLDLYEPKGAPAPAAPNPPSPPPAGGNQAQVPPSNPLQMAGLQPQSMLISVRGSYPQLLGFLQRLEALNVLVIQSNLRLEVPPAPPAETGKAALTPVTMKLSLTLYGKPPGAETTAQATGAPATPGASAPATTRPGAAAPPGAAGSATPPAAPATPPAGAPPGPATAPAPPAGR